MAIASATLTNLRQSPRKVRVVARLVQGKKVADAIISLQFTEKRASDPIRKLIESALANAKAQSIETENLVVKTIEVNSGKILYRRMPAARGSAHPIRKRTSQISITLGDAPEKKTKQVKKSKVVVEKAEAEPAPKKKATKAVKSKE